MGVETGWDEWLSQDLILDERLSGPTRYFKNFVMTGFGLANGGGLNVLVGQAGVNFAYVNGYEILQTNQLAKVLSAGATNHVFLKFAKIPDPVQGTMAVTISVEVNTTGIPPADSIKLGEVDTTVVVTAIRLQDNRFRIHDAKLETDLACEQKQLQRYTPGKGTAFPTTPAPVAGEHFVRTDLPGNPEFMFDGVVWKQFLTSGASGAAFFEDELVIGLAGQTAFTLSFARIASGLVVLSVNGQVLAEGTNFTLVGTALTWLNIPFALETTDALVVRYQTA